MPRRRILRKFLVGLVVGMLLVSGWVLFIWLTVPEVSSLVDGYPEQTSYMRLRASRRGLDEAAFRVEPVEVLSGAPLLACAMVKSEDFAFFQHTGINWHQLWWAISTRFTLTGASGITQQLARNVYLGPQRTPHRKLRELFIARELERHLSKRRILELYLNVIEWGEGVWGAGPAARHYFAKSPGQLDAFEATFLSALTAAPRQPLEGRNLERAAGVQKRVLFQLYASGIVDEAGWREADARASAVFACLRARQPLATALSCTEPPPSEEEPPPFVARRVAEPLERWLEASCGFEREVSEY